MILNPRHGYMHKCPTLKNNILSQYVCASDRSDIFVHIQRVTYSISNAVNMNYFMNSKIATCQVIMDTILLYIIIDFGSMATDRIANKTPPRNTCLRNDRSTLSYAAGYLIKNSCCARVFSKSYRQTSNSHSHRANH